MAAVADVTLAMPIAPKPAFGPEPPPGLQPGSVLPIDKDPALADLMVICLRFSSFITSCRIL